MVDKFGSGNTNRSGIFNNPMEDVLDMNNHEISHLKDPIDDRDAATKGYVVKYVNGVYKEIIKQTKKDLLDLRKIVNAKVNEIDAQLKKKVNHTECASTNGGKITTGLDMQGHAIKNLPDQQ